MPYKIETQQTKPERLTFKRGTQQNQSIIWMGRKREQFTALKYVNLHKEKKIFSDLFLDKLLRISFH